MAFRSCHHPADPCSHSTSMAAAVVYQTLTRAATPIILLHLCWRRFRGLEHATQWTERLGWASLPRPPGPLIWFHAVSVGEAMSAIPVIKQCIAKRPALNILLTTSTVTSYFVLQRIIPVGVLCQFAPIDTPPAVERFLAYWRPDAGIFLESELWPNLVLSASLKGMFLALLNARMSSKSFEWWCLPAARPLAAEILTKFQLILPLSNKEAVRYQLLGASLTTIHFAGNLKYAVESLDNDSILQDELCRLKEDIAGRLVWIAASTHAGEEEIIASVHLELKQMFPNLITIIAPRHPERGKQICMTLQQQGLQTVRRSNDGRIFPAIDVYIADTIGELKLFYQVSSVAFVGGSLFERMSGHNLAEAAAAGCAVITGSYIGHYSKMLSDFQLISPSSVKQVLGRDDLLIALKALFSDLNYLQGCRCAAQYAFERCAKDVLNKVWNYLETYVLNAVFSDGGTVPKKL